jgi:hypothetical protein
MRLNLTFKNVCRISKGNFFFRGMPFVELQENPCFLLFSDLHMHSRHFFWSRKKREDITLYFSFHPFKNDWKRITLKRKAIIRNRKGCLWIFMSFVYQAGIHSSFDASVAPLGKTEWARVMRTDVCTNQ